MNLKALFETQAKLDADILTKHPVQPGEDRLSKKILALQVELGECGNEWRGFKFWSNDQKPRVLKRIDCEKCAGTGLNPETLMKTCTGCKGSGTWKVNPLLEEYVDCLHFILSIGLDYGYQEHEIVYLHEDNFGVYTESDAIQQFINTFMSIREFVVEEDYESYEELFLYFVGLGRHMGFTWDQVEQAYYEKNKINLQRQENGY